MNIGDYCRNKYGIAKVIDIKNNNGIDVLIFDKPICFFVNKETGKIKEDKLFNQLALIDDIDLSKIKHSPNIIDLIEVGDFITYKKGNMYIDIPYRVYGTYNEILEETELRIDDEYLKDIEILSIVTKEQFEAMKYEIK